MIRLSEAMARLSCKDEVIPKHVKEAFRLLNKSIIRVESPDIDFDDEEPQQDLENGVSVRFNWLYNKLSLHVIIFVLYIYIPTSVSMYILYATNVYVCTLYTT